MRPSMSARVSGATSVRPLITLLIVAVETPASSASSASVRAGGDDTGPDNRSSGQVMAEL